MNCPKCRRVVYATQRYCQCGEKIVGAAYLKQHGLMGAVPEQLLDAEALAEREAIVAEGNP